MGYTGEQCEHLAKHITQTITLFEKYETEPIAIRLEFKDVSLVPLVFALPLFALPTSLLACKLRVVLTLAWASQIFHGWR